MSDIRVGIKLTTDGSGKVTAEITQVKKGLEETGKAAETAASKNKKAAADTEKAYSGLASQIDGVKKAFLAYVSVQAAWNAAKGITATADAWTNLNSRLRVVTGTQREFATALSDVSAIANRYQADINSVGAAYNRLAPIAANMGKSQQDLRASLESVSAALKLSGASTSEASETLRQFGQALSGPTVQMEEMNTIIDSASVLWQGLQRQFPDLIRQYGSLKEAVGKGALSNRELLEATIRLREEFDAQARTMSVTVSGALQVLSNEWEKYIGNADQSSETSKSLANGILLIAKNMDTLMYLPAKMVEGWGLILEAISKATEKLKGFVELATRFSLSDAFKSLFSPNPGGPPLTRQQQLDQYGVNGATSGSSNAGRDIMRMAQQYIGYSETKNREEMVKFLNQYSGTTFKDIAGEINAWCARFVSAVLQSNHIQNPQTASAKAYADWGSSVWKPGDGNKGLESLRPGDVAVFTRKGGAHVAFVDSIDAVKGTMNVLGGNQSNAVSIVERSIKDLIAVRRAPDGGMFGGKNQQIDALTIATKGLTDVQRVIVEKAMAAKVDPYMLLGIAQRESSFNPSIQNKTGLGLYQFQEGTGKDYGLKNDADRKNAEKSAEAATKLWQDLLDEFNGFPDQVRLALAAWNLGVKGVKDKLAQGKNPEDYTEGPHVQRILEYRKQWETKLSGQLSGVMDQKALKKGETDWKKMLDAQFDAYADHLKKLEGRRDNANTVELSAQRVQMEKLEAQRAKMEQQDKQAIANAQGSGSMGALDQAMRASKQHEEQYLKDKQALLMQGMDLEEKALNQRKAHIAQMIAKAQELGSLEALKKIPDLQAESAKIDADIKALANQRKETETKLNSDLVASSIKSEDEKRKAQRQTADDAVRMEQERIAGLQAEFDLKQKGAEYSQAVMAQYADDQKAAIDAGLDQARTQAATAEAERAQLLASKQGVSALLQERENITANLRDQLGLLEMEKQAALDKLTVDAQQLDYQKQIADWQLQQTATIDPNNQQAILAARAKVLEIEGQITDNAQKQLDVMNAQTGQQAKLQAEAAKAITANDKNYFKEQQLEMNAFWDQTIQRAQEYANTWKEISGQQDNAFAELAVHFAKFSKNLEQIEQKYKELGSNENPFTGETKDRDILKQNFQIVSQTALAMRSMYKEGTQGYAAMTAAAGAMQIAVQALNIVDGISAVLNQLKGGDPYSAIPRALAVAGMVASLGVSIGGLSGGSTGGATRPPDRQTGENGGVFGDNEAKSDSIVQALETVAANSNADLDYSKGMLRSLKNIELSMAGVTNTVIRNVSAVVPDNQKLGLQAIGSGLFANVEKYLSDFGIASWGQKLSTILASGFQANVFTDITREIKVFGNTFRKEVRRKFSELDQDVADQFTRTIVGIAESVQQAGEAFGISASDFNDKIRGFVLNLGTVSLQGLKGEELQQAIAAMFSGAADAIARQVMPGLEEFAQVGEGAFQTMIRVSNSIMVAEGMLSQFGLTAIKYTDVLYKQGDVAAEIVRQSITAYEGIFSTIGSYIDGAVGSAEELLAVYQDLLSIRAMSSVVGLSFRNLSNDMIVAAGGVSALKDSISFYLENFIGAGGVAAAKATELADSFRRLGVRVPESQDAFRQLVEGIDQSTVAGQKLWAQLLKLAPAFLEAKQAAQELADLRTKLKGGNPFAELDSTWKQLWKDWGTVMDGELAMIEGPFNAKIKAQQDAIQGWAQAISTGTASIGLLTGELVRLSIAKAPAAVLKSIEQAIVTLTKNVSEWQKKIKEANAAIESLKDDQSAAAAAKRQEILQEQGWSLIGSIADMWEKMISGIRSAVASMQDQIDQLSPNAAQAAYNTASGRVTDAYANLNEYRGRMAGMGQATDPTVELGYIQGIQSAIMARYNAELALLQQAQQEMVAAQTERLNAELDAWIETRTQALDVQIEAINAALEAEIQAINDALDARIKAQQQADAAVIKSMQKALDAQIKAQQKTDEAVIKAMQKRFDAENKVTQKQFDAVIKARQKEFDAANKLMDRGFQAEQKALQKQQDARMKVLTDELDAANRLADAIKSIAEYAQSLKLGANSPLSPEARMTEAQRQYQALLAKANAGDADALGKLAGASDAYLEAARTYYGSSTNYEDIFKGVQQAMESIGGMSAPDPNSIQSRIDALRESQEREMQALQDQQDAIMDTIREQQQEAIDALRETQQEQLDAIREAQQDQVDAVRETQQDNIDAMRETAQDQIDAVREAQQANIEAMRKAAQDQIETARKAAQDQIDAARKLAEKEIADERAKTQQTIADLADPEKNQAIRDLRDRTVAELQALQQQARDLEQAAQAKAEAWINEVRDWMTQNQLNDSTMIAALRGIYTGITQQPPAFAKGGQAMPGLAMVGEQGPEIVRFNTPGQVYTASETRSMLKPGTDEETKTILREIKTEAKASVTVQSTAFQRMIDKLNSMDDRLHSMERQQRLKA